jgi:hypothetical protein
MRVVPKKKQDARAPVPKIKSDVADLGVSVCKPEETVQRQE